MDIDLAQKRVVILEDHSASGSTITNLLNDQNLVLVPALGVEDVQHRVHRERVDMILVDGTMPGFEGPMAIRGIRSRFKRRQYVPILVVLGERDDSTCAALLKSGVTDFLSKPLIPSEMIARIQGYLKTKVLYDELAESNVQLARERDTISLTLRELLPNPPEDIPGWEFALRHQASGVAAGDYCDILPLANGQIALAIADVLGRGVQAAMRVTMAKAILRAQLRQGSDPGTILGLINSVLLETPSEDPFMTIYLGVLDPVNGVLHQSTAGHLGPILQTNSNGLQVPEIAGGPPIGVLPDARYTSSTVEIPPATRMYLATNGLWDQRSAAGETIGHDHFLELIENTAAMAPNDALDLLVTTAMAFVDGSQPQDDMTLLLVSRE